MPSLFTIKILVAGAALLCGNIALCQNPADDFAKRDALFMRNLQCRLLGTFPDKCEATTGCRFNYYTGICEAKPLPSPTASCEKYHAPWECQSFGCAWILAERRCANPR